MQSSKMQFHILTPKNREKIIKLYQKIKEKAPEKLKDLDIAFILFPPSKFRHIESLVERWTQNH